MAALRSSIAATSSARGEVQYCIGAVQVWSTSIRSSSPWENGYFGRFNARLRDDFLNGESPTPFTKRRFAARPST